MPWPKGKTKAKTGGRRKGSKNIAPGAKSPELRELVLRALEAVGGQEYLEGIARDEPRAFLALVGRLLPTKVEGEVEVRPTEIRIITGFDSGPHER